MRSAVRNAAFLLALGGCAPKSVERITMEPVIIRVEPGGGGSVETPDPLLDELAALQEEGRCDEAIPRLEKFLEDFPESLRFGEAVVRLGLCHEQREEWERARGYHRWAAENAHFELALEAALHAAWCLEKMGEPELAAAEYAALADLGERAPAEARAMARLRQAIGLFAAGRSRKAHTALERGIVAFSALSDPPASVRSAAAEARFSAAEEKARAFSAIALEYPQRRMNRRVRQKLLALLEARTAYEGVGQIKDAEWAAAAYCRIGELFEELQRALTEVPAPPGFDEGQRARYAAKVAEHAKQYLQQAFDHYLQVSALGERVGLDSPWVTRARERIRALEPLLKQRVLPPGDEDASSEPPGSP